MITGFVATIQIGAADAPAGGTPLIESVPADPQRDALYRLFEESPGDLAAYGAMADRLDELGYASLAHAYRWMWKRGKYPHRRKDYCQRHGTPVRKVPARFRWAWYRGDGPNGRTLPYPTESNILPFLLIPGPQQVYVSHAAAVMALANWLQRLKDAYDLEPAKRGL